MRERLQISRPITSPNSKQMLGSESMNETPRSFRLPDDNDMEDTNPLMSSYTTVDAKDIKKFLGDEQRKVKLSCLRTKRPTTYANLIAMVVAPTIAYISARFLQKTTTEPEVYAKVAEADYDTYVLAANIALAFLMLFVFAGFDLIGRSIVMVTAGVFLAAVVATYPYWMPYSIYLGLSNYASVCPWTVLSLSPLLVDYIR